jgi:uncharacterized Zn-binding protein involved in type VI secretion
LKKAAARIGDMHTCPQVSPGGAPHVGGPIVGPGCATVFIEGAPAATVGDACLCNGGMDQIITGSTGVFIEGREAARQGDRCAHGGVIQGGNVTVFIGEAIGRNFLCLPCLWENEGSYNEPSKEVKVIILNQVIQNCKGLLEKKLELLVNDDPQTMNEFNKWFGELTHHRKGVIVQRINKQLELFKNLTLDNFKRISYEIDYRKLFAYVYPTDYSYIIYIGNPFWNKKFEGKYSREQVLIHETSHFNNIGKTKDYGYDEECDMLAKDKPEKALINADSYAYFIIA